MGQLPDTSASIPEEEATVNRQAAGSWVPYGMKPKFPASLKLTAPSYLKNSTGIQRTGIMKRAIILVTTSSADQNNINHLYNGIIDFEECWNFLYYVHSRVIINYLRGLVPNIRTTNLCFGCPK